MTFGVWQQWLSHVNRIVVFVIYQSVPEDWYQILPSSILIWVPFQVQTRQHIFCSCLIGMH